MSLTPLGPGREFDLIRKILEAAGGEEGLDVRVGPGDDGAVVGGGPLAVTADLSIEGVHFRRSWLQAREIGYRAVAASLSDLAAMAAEPVGILVSLGLRDGTGPEMVRELARGFREACGPVGATLLGGDVTRSPGPLILDVTALGRASNPVRRDGARPGDHLWVTGRLGGAGAAVRIWESGSVPPEELRAAFARPVPRIREARWLAERLELHALIDLSDGLVGDAGHLAAAGGVGVVLDTAAVPIRARISELGWGPREVLRVGLSGGEDYELCLAAEPGSVEEVAEEFQERFELELTRVGEVTDGEGVLLREGPGGTPAPPPWHGFDHFRGKGAS